MNSERSMTYKDILTATDIARELYKKRTPHVIEAKKVKASVFRKVICF